MLKLANGKEKEKEESQIKFLLEFYKKNLMLIFLILLLLIG